MLWDRAGPGPNIHSGNPTKGNAAHLRVDGEDDEGVVVPAPDGLDARGQ